MQHGTLFLNMNMNRINKAKRVTWIGFGINLLLAVIKIAAGFVGKSSAIIADGMHSLSDFITDAFVLVFIDISGKAKDDDHRYGHGKYETFATLLISIVLLLVGVGIFWGGMKDVLGVMKGETLQQPTFIALGAALLSIVFKEGLYWYTKTVGKSIKNNAVIANAWHHRSDAFSSIGTAIGISGAIFMGPSWRILDPIAAVIVSIFIVKVALELGMPSMHELLEKSLPKETEQEIIRIIESNPNVIRQHNLKTRKIGYLYAIDVHVKLDQNMTFVKSHDVATEIEVALRERFGEHTVTNIHTEPF